MAQYVIYDVCWLRTVCKSSLTVMTETVVLFACRPCLIQHHAVTVCERARLRLARSMLML